jgi:hypothetical protein
MLAQTAAGMPPQRHENTQMRNADAAPLSDLLAAN